MWMPKRETQKPTPFALRFPRSAIACKHSTCFMSNQPGIQLCPAQKSAFDNLSAGLQVGSIVRLWGGVGRGKTTILKELHKQVGGVLLNMKDFVEASAKNHPLALEETLYQLHQRMIFGGALHEVLHVKKDATDLLVQFLQNRGLAAANST